MAYTFKHGDRPLDDFTIQRAVGRGGFGEVYYAVSDGGREVALKYLKENPQIELRGVSHCMNLKSPHLVSIFDVKKNLDGEFFIVMEYVSGPSLRDLLLSEPSGLGPQKTAFFLRELAKGLGYLHDRGIVHRDLKPGNVFYDEGYVKIGDYGLSKFISVSRHSVQTASVGTVHYMAPEVGSGNYHRGIDIYALGVMVYEMLLGKVPFEGSTMGEVLMKHLTDRPEVDALPAPFATIIRRALEKDPKERYQTVYEMLDDLLEVDDVQTSLAGFNPASLSMVVPRSPQDLADSPVPSPNPTPNWARPQAPPQPRQWEPANLDVRQLPPSMTKKLDVTRQKVEKRLNQLDAKHGRRRPQAPSPPPRQFPNPARHASQHEDHHPLSKGEVLQRIMLALAMSVGLGLLVGMFVGGSEEGYVSAVMCTVGLAGGVTVGCRALAHLAKRHIQPVWIERLYIGVPTAAFLGIGVAPFADRYGDRALAAWAALVLATLFAGWRQRIDAGSRGKLSPGSAFWLGLAAFILSAMFSEGDTRVMALGAGVAAAGSLVVQALAWLFPLERWMNGIAGRQTAPRRAPRYKAREHDAMHMPDNDRRLAGNGSQIDRPDEAPFRSAEGYDPATPHWRQTAEDRTYAVPSGKRRWMLTRAVGAMLGFACLLPITIGIIYILRGEAVTSIATAHSGPGGVKFSVARASLHPEETIQICALVAACVGLMLFAFRKTTRFKTGGFYRDTLRPLLMIPTMAALAAAITALVVQEPGNRVMPMASPMLMVFGLLFLVLFFVRGKKTGPDFVEAPGVEAEPREQVAEAV